MLNKPEVGQSTVAGGGVGVRKACHSVPLHSTPSVAPKKSSFYHLNPPRATPKLRGAHGEPESAVPWGSGSALCFIYNHPFIPGCRRGDPRDAQPRAGASGHPLPGDGGCGGGWMDSCRWVSGGSFPTTFPTPGRGKSRLQFCGARSRGCCCHIGCA